MSCTFNRELLALYTDGDATEAEHQVTAAHLERCPECQGIVAQYRSLAVAVADSLAEAKPVALRPVPRRRLTAFVAAVATIILLLGAMRAPVVAAAMARLYPFMAVFEMDAGEVLDFLRQYAEDHKRPAEVYYPEQFATVAEAEEAWGGRIPLPTALPSGMELYRISMFRWESGHKEVTFYYNDQQKGRNVAIQIATRKQQRKVPRGATSETLVNGQKAVVIKGTFGQYPGQPLKWEPDSDIHLFFPVGDLYAVVFTAGTGATLAELVQVAESIR